VALYAQGSTHLISRTPQGVQAQGISSSPKISPDGRFVGFQNNAPTFTGDIAGNFQVMLKDRLTGAVELISRSSSGQPGNAGAFSAGIPSDDGRFVAFSSQATNLVTPDGNGNLADAFVRDRLMQTTERVGRSTLGVQANERVFVYDMTPDGLFVGMTTMASNLAPFDSNNTWDVVLRDRLSGITELISAAPNGAAANGESRGGQLSADGRFVLFDSFATDLVPGDINGFRDVFVRDRLTQTTTLVSVGLQGAGANGVSNASAISADGSRILFWSVANNLVPGDVNGQADFFLVDLALGTTTLVHVGHLGQQADNGPLQGALSENGRFVAFSSLANNLVANDTNVGSDLFLHDTLTAETLLISVNSMGVQGAIPCGGIVGSTTCGGQNLAMAFSSNGRVVAFEHTGGVLVPEGLDANGNQRDIFIHEWSLSTSLLSAAQIGQPLLIQFRARLDPGEPYVAAISLGGLPGIRWVDRHIPLLPDVLFLASLTMPIPELSNFSGLLDLNGMAQASVAIPASPSLLNVAATIAFVTVNFSTGQIEGISNGATFTVGP
jgi:Tol biopolymer transport system component